MTGWNLRLSHHQSETSGLAKSRIDPWIFGHFVSVPLVEWTVGAGPHSGSASLLRSHPESCQKPSLVQPNTPDVRCFITPEHPNTMTSTPDSSASGPPAVKPRRSHTKTRTGCAVCKRRKIKVSDAHLAPSPTLPPSRSLICLDSFVVAFCYPIHALYEGTFHCHCGGPVHEIDGTIMMRAAACNSTWICINRHLSTPKKPASISPTPLLC